MRARLLLGGVNVGLATLDYVNGRPESALPTVAVVVGALLALTALIDYAWPPA